ncbi:hypothetical protein [Mesobacillus foraminis]|nr:hypothetical protein [Mesobacillus foraminis]
MRKKEEGPVGKDWKNKTGSLKIGEEVIQKNPNEKLETICI